MVITGKEMIEPYLIKSMKLYLMSFLPIKFVNIIPASAPIGVRNAPILLPTIEAYTPSRYASPLNDLVRLENKMLIGMLLIRLLAKKDV